MNFKILLKVIFLFSTLIKSPISGKTLEINSSETQRNSPTISYFLTEEESLKTSKNEEKNLNKKYNSYLNGKSISKFNKTFRNHFPLFLLAYSNTSNEIEIQSEIQSEANNIVKAEGDVLVTYKGNILRADRLIYDKTKKILVANGDVSLSIGEQLFKMVRFEYDFNKKTGYLYDVKGLIKADNLIDDLFSNFDNTDIKKDEILKEIKKDQVSYTPNRIQNWIFFTDKIQIDGNKWSSAKATFTNDLLELKQVKIEVNSLEAFAKKEELRFKSSINFLILDEKIHIPFWFGDRTLTKEINYENNWTIGFDNIDKDGLYLGRKIQPKKIFNNFTLDLEPQFLIQRSLKGNTNSFVNKGDSITGNKIKRDANLKDYFALNSQIKGKFDKWSLEIDQQNNSFDPEKFSDAIRLKTNLSKDLTFLNSKWNKSFYGIYRDRVWNGSIGEAEIYGGYGSKLEKQNSWVINGISNNEVFSLGFANFKAEALNSKNLVKTTKGNFFYSLDQKIPINVDKDSDIFIDSSYNYISKPVKKGISLNTKLELLYSFYGSGNNQQYLGIGAGPEFVFGDFKKKSFDYTRISFLPFYKIKSGESLFKFDQVSDKFTLGIALDQQLFGPLILKNSATLKVSRAKDYAEFINSKISLNWKKRSYEFGIFYQPHNEAGGIAFTLFGFE